MTTTGSVDVNLTPISNSINSASTLGANVTGGVADQGDLIGLAIGLTIAIGLLFGVVALMLVLVVKLIRQVKGIKHA